MSSVVKTNKMVAMKMDIVTENIVRICSRTDSPYENGRRMLAESRSVLRTNPKRSLRLMKYAEKEIIRESLAAQEYNRNKKTIPQLNDRSIAKLDEEYHDLLRKGRYDKARRIAIQISNSDSILNCGQPIGMKMASYNDDAIIVSITNSSTHDINVRRFISNLNGKAVQPDTGYPFVVRRNSSIDVGIPIKDIDTRTGKLTLEYDDHGIIKDCELKIYLESDD